jgi:type II secretory pathway component PulF
MRTFPATLPHRMSALVEAGLKTGKLPYFMQHVLEYQRRNAQMRRRILRNLAYPALIFLFAASIVLGILVGIVPSSKKIFDDFGTELPGLTKVLIAVSDSAVGATSWVAPVAERIGWPSTILLLFCAAAGVILLLGWFRIAPIDGLRHWAQRTLRLAPIVGSVFQTAALSNFFRLVALLVEAGVPLPESLRLAAAVSDDGSLEAGAKRVSQAIEQGDTPLDAVRNAETLPREVLPIFRWADNRKLFIEALRGAADIYAVRSHLHAGVTGIILAPALIFGVGITVGLVVIAMFLPLIKLLNDLA